MRSDPSIAPYMKDVARCSIVAILVSFWGGCQRDGTYHDSISRASVESEVGRQCWERILAVKSIEAEETPSYWINIGVQENAIFWEMVAGPKDFEALRYLVRQFGKHGPQADLRWLFMDSLVFLPNPEGDVEPPAMLVSDRLKWIGPLISDAEPPIMGVNDRPVVQAYTHRVKAMQLEACRWLVEHWLSDPESLDRYYHAALWTEMFLRYPQEFGMKYRYGYLKEKFAGQPRSDIFWWQARSFIMSAHATGRDDLWVNASAEELPDRCSAWVAWLEENLERGIPLIATERGTTWTFASSPDPEADWFENTKPPDQPFPDYEDMPEFEVHDILCQIRSSTFWSENQGALVDGEPAEITFQSMKGRDD